MRSNVLFLIVLLFTGPVFAEQTLPAYMQPRSYLLKQISFTERMTYRENHEGANFSPMVSWEPQYRARSPWVIGGLLGVAPMSSQKENFFAFRYHVSLSYEGLSCWIYPEVFLGAETWSASVTTTYTSFGGNVRLRLLPAFKWFDPFAKYFESWSMGYQVVLSKDYVANQINLGVRFALD